MNPQLHFEFKARLCYVKQGRKGKEKDKGKGKEKKREVGRTGEDRQLEGQEGMKL